MTKRHRRHGGPDNELVYLLLAMMVDQAGGDVTLHKADGEPLHNRYLDIKANGDVARLVIIDDPSPL